MAHERLPGELDPKTGSAETAQQIDALRGALADRDARERQLRSREQRWAAAAKMAGVGMWTWRPLAAEMEWSTEVFHLLGFALDEISPSYEAFINAFHAADQPALLLGLESIFTKFNPFPLQLRVPEAEGRERQILADGQVWVDPGTGERELVGTLQDVTALRELTCDLAQTEHRLQLITETVPDVFWMNSPGVKEVLYVSPAYERLWGRSIESLYADPSSFLAAVIPEDRQPLEELLSHHWRGEAYEVDYRIRDAGGVVRAIHERGFPVRDESGHVWAMIGVSSEVTEKGASRVASDADERIADELRKREREHLTLAESSPDTIMRFDTLLKLVFINKSGEHTFDVKREDVVGKSNREVLVHVGMRSLWEAKLLAAYEFKEPQSFEFNINGGHEQRDFETRVVPELDSDGAVESLLTITHDITESKRAQSELWRLNEKLQFALEELQAKQRQVIQSEKLSALGTLAAGVAHELNNPLMGAMNYVEYASGSVKESKLKDVLSRALRELERMRDLLNNMLAFARPIQESVESLNAKHVVEKVQALMEEDFAERGIELSVEIESDLPKVKAKESQLQQVLVNLLMNSRDALDNANEKRVRIRAYRLGGNIAIEVNDSGPGIPEDMQGRIFDPFFTTKPPGKGTGLGLSIARTVLLELGGDLRLTDGPGATFVVTLPGDVDE